MSDRKLLELAAKAAGIEIDYWHSTGAPMIRPEGNAPYKWNPLTDDGDALRLAVKLNMQINFEAEPDGPIVLAIFAHLPTLVSAHEELGRDPYAATRRAIVRAAAEIGSTK